MKKLIVMSGVSGSGKSTTAKQLAAAVDLRTVAVGIVSADTFFERSGEYKFEPTKLGEAHGECFRHCIDSLRRSRPLAIVDNTNTTLMEIAPYMLAAQAYGYDAEIIRLVCANEAEVEQAVARSKHGVTFEKGLLQHHTMQLSELPPWWKYKTVPVTFEAEVPA